jgi:NTE family protein
MALPNNRLRSVPFFRALPEAELAAIGDQLEARAVRKGTVVFREGDAADSMYIVDSGHLDIFRGRGSRPVASLGPGSVAGELALLLGEPRSATARAASACRLLRLSREDLDELLVAHPAIAVELSAELGRKLVTTTRRLTHGDTTRVVAVFGDAPDRLADAIGRERVKVACLPLREVPPAALDGQRFRDLDLAVIAMPRSSNALARAAIDAAEWVVATEPLPRWVTQRHSPDRVRMLDASVAGLAATARLVSGQAVALALSSGGSKVVAHVGVIDALRNRGVQFDAVAGASGGALVATAVALHKSTEDMTGYIREFADHVRPRHWDFHLIPRTGVMKGKRLRDLFDRWFESRDFKDTAIPLYVVASDVVTGEEVVIDSGPLADALRASMSIPGALDPWRHQGRLLIDGGVTNPLPAAPLRRVGFERVLASNVAGKDVDPSASPGDRLPNILNVMLRTVNLMEAESIKAQLGLADVVIRPHVHARGSFDFANIDAFVAEGMQAVAREDDELQRLGFSRA